MWITIVGENSNEVSFDCSRVMFQDVSRYVHIKPHEKFQIIFWTYSDHEHPIFTMNFMDEAEARLKYSMIIADSNAQRINYAGNVMAFFS